MTNTKATKNKQASARSPWADLAAETSTLEVLEEHHKILYTFCADAYSPETRGDDEDESSTRLELSFRQYCVAVSTLIQYGSPTQHFQYLYHTYASTNERGIDRHELFQLLQDHSERAANIAVKNDKLLHVTDPRQFDKLYTWLKKHFIFYDEARCGYLTEKAAFDMLQAHPNALARLRFQLAPFIKQIKDNNTRYADQAAAALD